MIRRLMIIACAAIMVGAASCDETSTVLYPIVTAGKIGFINAEGDVMIEPQYDFIADHAEYSRISFGSQISDHGMGEFSEGLAALRVKERSWIFIDETGQIAFEIEAISVDPFSDGYSHLIEWSNQGILQHQFLDKQGNIVFNKTLDEGESFSEGLAAVVIDGKPHYINTSGEIAIRNIRGGSFNEGLARAKDNDTRKCGYIDKTGEFVIEPVYSSTDKFSDGLGRYKNLVDLSTDEWEYGYLNRDGEVVIDPIISKFEPVDFSDGMARAFDSARYLQGFIDKTGELVIPLEYEHLRDFSEGLAAVRIDDKWGYIDKQNNTVIEPLFNNAWPFKNGLAWVETEEGNGYINKKGEFIWGPEV